ncbi:unnamed protein product [Victoria cruziana]
MSSSYLSIQINQGMAPSLPSCVFRISLFAVFLLFIMNGDVDAFECADVDLNISPCIPYLTSKDSAGNPSDSCCQGMEAIKEFGKEKEDREEICRCLERGASEVPDINPDKVPLLPGECGINLGFPIAIDIDCSNIQ